MKTFTTTYEAIQAIKEAYENGDHYFHGEIWEQEFKIRMNKDHARNSRRNDDQFIHNLSLINTNCPEGVIRRKTNGGKIQRQEHNVFDWSDALMYIEDFFYLIEETI